MKPDQAADLAARTLAAIDRTPVNGVFGTKHHVADRERVASDLAGLRMTYRHGGEEPRDNLAWQILRDYCADGLRRTAVLYGVTS